MREERITSRQNPLLRHVKKLLTSRSYRQQCGEYAGDGTKLLEEALRWDAGVKTIVAAENVALPPVPDTVRVARVPMDVMESVSQMQTPQGAIFLCDLPQPEPLHLTGSCLILDGIQDPGNVGTILRTADAMEIPVVLAEGCADPYSPKTVRATMGAIFRTRPQMAGREEIAAACRAAEIPLIATALSERSVDIRTLPLGRAAVVIGSEGRGVSPELLALSQQQAIIPMNPRCESLNAAVAATIVLWQMRGMR